MRMAKPPVECTTKKEIGLGNNLKAMFAVIKSTQAVAKIRLEKIKACTGFESMTYAVAVIYESTQ